MIRNVDVNIPVLWGDGHFIKNEWGPINYLVGANGTGKSLLAEELKARFTDAHLKSRYLNAERLQGMERRGFSQYGGGQLKRGFNISNFNDYKNEAEQAGLSSSAIVILKERLDIRIKIEALLSDLFGKTIRLVEEGGYLKPKMRNISGGDEYHLSESECHGLKELITLLTFLYDPSKNCIFFDEPELHLHPQFQSFFLNEIRKVAGDPLQDPSKKIFFIITHSPYFIDLKSVDDLKNIIVCQPKKVPTFVSSLDAQDEFILRKFIPRFNTHHKQFFFSPNPVFVEGYTDQQIISILFEKIGINVSASGSCIIDVGGKDELGVFYRLCSALQVNCRIIADLDAIFRGRLKEVVSADSRSQSYIQNEGLGTNLSEVIGTLETRLSSLATVIIGQTPTNPDVIHLRERLVTFAPADEHKKRLTMLLGIIRFQTEISTTLDTAQVADLTFIIGRIAQIHNAFKTCNTFIVPKGEIENYYTQTTVDYLNISNKDTAFHTERDYLLQQQNAATINTEYAALLSVIKLAVPLIEIEIRKHVRFVIIEWIQAVQNGIARKEINNQNQLLSDVKVNYALYNQILQVDQLTVNADSTFSCSITLKESLLPTVSITFDHSTVAHSFTL